MTSGPLPTTSQDDALAAVRAQAAERGVSVGEFVREALWRTRGEEAWERALAAAAGDDSSATRD